MDAPDAKYHVEPLPTLQLPHDYHSHPLFFRMAPAERHVLVDPEGRHRSSSRSLEQPVTTQPTRSPKASGSRSGSTRRSQSASSRRSSAPPLAYRATRASVLRQKRTIENEIEALRHAEQEAQEERDYVAGFARAVPVVTGEAPPLRTTRSASLRLAHARRTSENATGSGPSTPRVRSTPRTARLDEAPPVAVRATRTAELRRSLNTQRLRELEEAREKLAREEALLQHGGGGALRESRRASATRSVTMDAASEDVAPAVKSNKAALLLRERVQAKMKELQLLEALEAAAQEALLHPPSRRGSAEGRGQPLSPRSTKSSLLRGRSAAAQRVANAASAEAAPRRRRLSRDKGGSRDIPPSGQTRAAPEKSTEEAKTRGAPSPQLESTDKGCASSPPPGAVSVLNACVSAASSSAFVVHRHPSASVLSSVSETDDPAALLPSAIWHVEHVFSDSDARDDVKEKSIHDGGEAAAAAPSSVPQGDAHEVPCDAARRSSEAFEGSHVGDLSPAEEGSTAQAGASPVSGEAKNEKLLANEALSAVAVPVNADKEACSSRPADSEPVAASPGVLNRHRLSSSASDAASDARASAAQGPVEDAGPSEPIDSPCRSELSARDASRMGDEEESPATPTAVESGAGASPMLTVDKDDVGAASCLHSARVEPHVTTVPGAPPPVSQPLRSGDPIRNEGRRSSPSPVVPRSGTPSSVRTSVSAGHAQQAEVLDRLRRTRAAGGVAAQHPLQPFSGIGALPMMGSKPSQVLAPVVYGATAGDARTEHDDTARSRSSSSSSVESVPTFAATDVVPSARADLVVTETGSPSLQWSRRPTPPLPLAAPPQPSRGNHADTSRASISWVDFSAVSASPVSGSPSPAAIRQLRLNTARVLYRRYFTKWAQLATRTATSHVVALHRQERSQTAPPQAPDSRTHPSARPVSPPSPRVVDGLRLPPTNRAPHAHPAVDAPAPATPLPRSVHPPRNAPEPSTPGGANGPRLPPPLPAPPSPQSLSSAPPRGGGAPHARPAFPPPSLREERSVSQGSMARSPRKGLQVPRLQESFASLPRGVAGEVSFLSAPGTAHGSWLALEPSQLSARPSTAPRDALMSPVNASVTPSVPVASPARDSSFLDATAVSITLRMPPAAPDAWDVALPAGTSLPSSPHTSPSKHAGRGVPAHPTTRRGTPLGSPPRELQAALNSVTTTASGDGRHPSRRRSTTLGDSPRELAERTPCDATLDALLRRHHGGSGSSVEGSPLDLAATGGEQEPSQHAPTPLLSNLPTSSNPMADIAVVCDAAESSGETQRAALRDPANPEVPHGHDSTGRAWLAEPEEPLREPSTHRRLPFEENEEEEAETLVEQGEAGADGIARRYRPDGSRGFSSSSALSGPADDSGRNGGEKEASWPTEVAHTPSSGTSCRADSKEAESLVTPHGSEERATSVDTGDSRHVDLRGAAPLPHPNASPELEPYRPESPIPSAMGSVGRAETYYMSVSNPTPSDSRWGAGSPEGSPMLLNAADPELQQEFGKAQLASFLNHYKYVHRDM